MHPDSTESSATSTGTIVLNQNALKPKNSQNQTHSVSQMSLQTTGISGCGHNHPTSLSQLTTATHKSPNSHSPKIQCSYPTLASCNKEQQPPSQQTHPQQLQLPSTASISSNSSSCSNSISSSTSISTINTTSNVLTTGTYIFDVFLNFKLVLGTCFKAWTLQVAFPCLENFHIKIRCLEIYLLIGNS